MLNGSPPRPFPAKRGLKQGDPVSPYLFVIVMEYLKRLLKGLRVQKEFKFHPKRAKVNLIQLGFADDLFYFAKGI